MTDTHRTSEANVVLIKAPRFYGRHFWRDIFAEAKRHDVPVIIVKGSVRIQAPQGGGATIKNFSLWGPRL